MLLFYIVAGGKIFIIHQLHKSFNNIRLVIYITYWCYTGYCKKKATSNLILLFCLHSGGPTFFKCRHIGSLALINWSHITSFHIWWWNRFFVLWTFIQHVYTYSFVELRIFVFVTIIFLFFFCRAEKNVFPYLTLT